MRWLIFLLLFVSGCVSGEIVLETDGPFVVDRVIDGDTLEIDEEIIRLSGINTPETAECYYEEAKEALKELSLGKEVYLEKDKTDKGKYGRLLRYIYVNDLMINGYLVENGFARVYDKYDYDTKRYDELKEKEEIAINNNLGLWNCEEEKCLFVASKNSDKLHEPGSKYAKRIKKENLLCFKSLEEIPEKYLK